jgi:phosphoribosylaminoimidazolecarboxamide formyltransferase/IMP cyclohydrolase
MPSDPKRVARALLSVSDKTGLVPFAQALAGRGVALVSTGGTGRTLAEAGLMVEDVSELTGFPEMMDGRVKTLHPAVHGGLLAVRANPEHASALRRRGSRRSISSWSISSLRGCGRRGRSLETCIEMIDIGGPAMIRAGRQEPR